MFAIFMIVDNSFTSRASSELWSHYCQLFLCLSIFNYEFTGFLSISDKLSHGSAIVIATVIIIIAIPWQFAIKTENMFAVTFIFTGC